MRQEELKNYIDKIKIKIGVEEEKLSRMEDRLKKLKIKDKSSAKLYLKKVSGNLKKYKDKQNELEERLDEILDGMVG